MNKAIEAEELKLSAARKANDMTEFERAYNQIEKLKESDNG